VLPQAANVLGTNAQYYQEINEDGAARKEPKHHGLGPKTDVGTEHVQPVVRQAGSFVQSCATERHVGLID
jgi:hypothetical protein